ncbi:MAG: hypothetical protein RR123_04180 [Clostridia bacterium]
MAKKKASKKKMSSLCMIICMVLALVCIISAFLPVFSTKAVFGKSTSFLGHEFLTNLFEIKPESMEDLLVYGKIELLKTTDKSSAGTYMVMIGLLGGLVLGIGALVTSLWSFLLHNKLFRKLTTILFILLTLVSAILLIGTFVLMGNEIVKMVISVAPILMFIGAVSGTVCCVLIKK